ncbi:TraM recognition domain-containing protein [Paenibacillus polymyxa]|uniref:TraM recognition domain-containing protein n=1 Tax=Paenibacillus polymyxa TaxID=1406 RepID=UPI003D2A0D0F
MQNDRFEDMFRGPTPEQQEQEKTLGYMVIAAVFLIVFCFAMGGIFAGLLIYLVVRFVIKRYWVLYAMLPLALFGIFILHGTGEWLSSLGFLSAVRLPFVATLAEKYLHDGKPFPLTGYSFVSAGVVGIILACVVHPIIQYFESKIIKSKHVSLLKKRADRKYKKFRLNRFKYNDRAQLKFRKSESKANFIGYDEFGERVELDDEELNSHMLVIMTTGGGKTVIIGTVIENAIRQGKPVFFMDGKGERESMLEFKAQAEKYGRKVHMFTDIDQLNFNFLRHGSPTQLRDKIMNLFEWSEPFYKINCSRFLQLTLRMLREFGETLDLATIYRMTFRSKVATYISELKEREEKELSRVTTEWEQYEETLYQLERAKNAVALTPEPEEEPTEKPQSIDESVPVAADDFFGFRQARQDKRAAAASEEPQPAEAEEAEPDESYAAPMMDLVKEKIEIPPQPDVSKEEAAKRYRKRMEKIEYYRERFFGEDSEDESEEEVTGINFNALVSLRNQVAELMESDLGPLFEETGGGMDLLEVTDRNEMAIFSLSGNKYRDYIKMLGRIVISEFNTIVDYRQKAGKKRMLMVCDEFSAYASHEIVDVVNKSRSAGGECVISMQGLSDTDKVDPNLTRQIINNCNTYLFGRVNDSEDASILAATLGTYEDGDITSQVKKDPLYKLNFESEMGTVRSVQRFRAHPDEIKELSKGEVFLARKLKKRDDGQPYVARVYVRNGLNLEGIQEIIS